MKLCSAVQEGCGYKDTLRPHRYFAPSAKYFTVCITYQPPLVEKGFDCVKHNILLVKMEFYGIICKEKQFIHIIRQISKITLK